MKNNLKTDMIDIEEKVKNIDVIINKSVEVNKKRQNSIDNKIAEAKEKGVSTKIINFLNSKYTNEMDIDKSVINTIFTKENVSTIPYADVILNKAIKAVKTILIKKLEPEDENDPIFKLIELLIDPYYIFWSELLDYNKTYIFLNDKAKEVSKIIKDAYYKIIESI